MAKAASKRQSEAFKRIAREIGCDENEDAFANVVRKIAKQKPSKRPDTSHKGGKAEAPKKP